MNGAIKCQQISGGDGYSTMGDGTQTYMFSFGPLSGLADMANGKPGTQFPTSSILLYPGATPLAPGDPATQGAERVSPTTAPSGRFPTWIASLGTRRRWRASSPIPLPCPIFQPAASTATSIPRQIMDVGVMNGNIPAPLMAIDEDDEFFLTLTNVGMIMRPDLFEQHTVHFHGYPNASSFYDGVPDASVAINIGGSFTYYYLAPDAGTYFWHCHITPPEHLQMGMVGQILCASAAESRPAGTSLYAALQTQQELDLRTACNSATDILCTNPLPPSTRSSWTRNVDRRQPASTPTTTATARPPTTSSIPSRSTASIPTSTLSA